KSAGTGEIARTPAVFCAVSAVTTLVPKTWCMANVLRSAWIPAPPPESEPAMVSATGGVMASSPRDQLLDGSCRVGGAHDRAHHGHAGGALRETGTHPLGRVDAAQGVHRKCRGATEPGQTGEAQRGAVPRLGPCGEDRRERRERGTLGSDQLG